MASFKSGVVRFIGRLVCLGVAGWCAAARGQITSIAATRDNIIISGRGDWRKIVILELAPCQSASDAGQGARVAQVSARKYFHIDIPRWDGPRDRLYSGFIACAESQGTNLPLGTIRFVEEMRALAKYSEPYPMAAGKKGLQVQMVDDAIALGVKHAALNIDLARLVDPDPNARGPSWQLDGAAYHFHQGYVEALDRSIKQLSDARIIVTLILLCYESGNPEVNRIMLHPDYSAHAPHHLSAFNTRTADGLRYFKACVEFLADRYGQPGFPHGRAVNFIVGNEVNAHWYWANLGEATMEQFADDYLRTVRVCNTAVHKICASDRVFISLEHHWNIRIDEPLHSFAGREFIDYFNREAQAGGNFDWNLAFHPYPENLFEPRTWNDKTATFEDSTPRITFKNIEMLPAFFQRRDLLWKGRQRHIILSEQGFHTPATPDGQTVQAAAYCYAYYKIARLPGIDAFILHRHVDDRDEDGLNLGLWTRNTNSSSPSQPEKKKMIYEVFRAADTPRWKQAFQFALPVIGIKDWHEIDPKKNLARSTNRR